jgi:hypothetical protein
MARTSAMAALLFGLAAPALAIEGGLPTTAFAAVGAGVQVAPDWVLTVQHAAVAVGSVYTNGYGGRTVLALYEAPGSGIFPANDLALLRLAPGAGNVPYLPVNGFAVPEGTFAPFDATIVSGSNHPPARGYAYTQIGESAVTADPDDSGPLGPVPVNWLVSMDSVVHVQSGDSGGGLFLGHVTDSSVLLGLSSALITDEQNNPLGSAFVQPAAYRDWIDAVMLADTADTQTLQWVAASVPEPAPWLLGLAGAAWLLRRRRA